MGNGALPESKRRREESSRGEEMTHRGHTKKMVFSRSHLQICVLEGYSRNTGWGGVEVKRGDSLEVHRSDPVINQEGQTVETEKG